MKKLTSIILIFIYLTSLINVPVVKAQSKLPEVFENGAIFCVRNAVQYQDEIFKIVCLISSKIDTNIRFEFGPAFSFGKMEFLGYEATDDIEFLHQSGNSLEFFVLPSERIILTLNIKADFKPTFKVSSSLQTFYFNDFKEFVDTINLIHSLETTKILKNKCEEIFGEECELSHAIKNINNLNQKYVELSDEDLNNIVLNSRITKNIDGKSVDYYFNPEKNEVLVYENGNYLGSFYLFSGFIPSGKGEQPQIGFYTLPQNISTITSVAVAGVVFAPGSSKRSLFWDYTPMDIRLAWGDFTKLPRDGWEIYVSIDKDDYIKKIFLISNLLKRRDIPHILVDPIHYDKITDGKYVIIYPKDDKEALEISNNLRELMYSADIRAGPPVEKAGKFSNGIFYSWNNRFGWKFIDEKGRLVSIEEAEMRKPGIPKFLRSDAFTMEVEKELIGEGVYRTYWRTFAFTGRNYETLLGIEEARRKPMRFVNRGDVVSGNFKEGDGVVFTVSIGGRRSVFPGSIISYDSETGRAKVVNLFGQEFEIPVRYISSNPDVHTFYDLVRKVEIRQMAEKIWKEGKLSTTLDVKDIGRILSVGFGIKGDRIYTLSGRSLIGFSAEDFVKIRGIENAFWDYFEDKLVVIPEKIAEKYPGRIRGLAITEEALNTLRFWLNEKWKEVGVQKGLQAFLGINNKGVIDKVYTVDITLGGNIDFWKYMVQVYPDTLVQKILGTSDIMITYFTPPGFDTRLTLGEILVSYEYSKKPQFYIMKTYFEDGKLKINLYQFDFSALSKNDINNLKYIRNYILDRTSFEVPIDELEDTVMQKFPELSNYLPTINSINIKTLKTELSVDEKMFYRTLLTQNGPILNDFRKSLENLKDYIEYGSALDKFYKYRGVETNYKYEYASNIYQEIRRRLDLWDSVLEELKAKGEISEEVYNLHKNIINKGREIGETLKPGAPIKTTFDKINELESYISRETSNFRKNFAKFLNNYRDFRTKFANYLNDLPNKAISNQIKEKFVSEVANAIENIQSLEIAEYIKSRPEFFKVFSEIKDNLGRRLVNLKSIFKKYNIDETIVESLLTPLSQLWSKLRGEIDKAPETIKDLGRTDNILHRLISLELNKKIKDLTPEDIDKLKSGKIVEIDENYIIYLDKEGRLTYTLLPTKYFDHMYEPDSGAYRITKYSRGLPILTVDDLNEIIKISRTGELPDKILIIGVDDGKLVSKYYDLTDIKKKYNMYSEIPEEFRKLYNERLKKFTFESLRDYADLVEKPMFGLQEELNHEKVIDEFLNNKVLIQKTYTNILSIRLDEFEFRGTLTNTDYYTKLDENFKKDFRLGLITHGIISPEYIPPEGKMIKVGEDYYFLSKEPNGLINTRKVINLEYGIDPKSGDVIPIPELSEEHFFFSINEDGEIKFFDKLPEQIKGTTIEIKGLGAEQPIYQVEGSKIEQPKPRLVGVTEEGKPRVVKVIDDESGEVLFDVNNKDCKSPCRILYSANKIPDPQEYTSGLLNKLPQFKVGEGFTISHENSVYDFTKFDDGWHVRINGETKQVLSESELRNVLPSLITPTSHELKPIYMTTPVSSQFIDEVIKNPGKTFYFNNYETSFALQYTGKLDNQGKPIINLFTSGEPLTITPERARELLQGSNLVVPLDKTGMRQIADTSFGRRIFSPIRTLTEIEFYPTIGPLDFVVFATASPIFYRLSEDKEEVTRRLTYNAIETFALEPAVFTLTARAVGVGVRSAIKGAIAGIGGVASLGLLAAMVAAETVAEDTIEEWLREGRLKDMGITPSGTALSRVFEGYADFISTSPVESALENSDLFRTVTSSIFTELYGTAASKVSGEINSLIGERKDEFLSGIQESIRLHANGPKGNYVDTINGVDYIWYMDEGKFEVKYTNERGNPVTITYSVTPDGNIIPTKYVESGKVGFNPGGCLGFGGSCCINPFGCEANSCGTLMNERCSSVEIGFRVEDIFRESQNRADDLVVDMVESDLNSLTGLKDPSEIVNRAKEIAAKWNSNQDIVNYFGRPITASDVIVLAQDAYRNKAEKGCSSIPYATVEIVNACVNQKLQSGNVFNTALNQAGEDSCASVSGRCASSCGSGIGYKEVFKCTEKTVCCVPERYVYTYKSCENMGGGCYPSACGAGYVSAGYCDKDNFVYCCVPTGKKEACENMGGICSPNECGSGYVSAGYCDKDNSVYCCVPTNANNYKSCQRLGGGCYTGPCGESYRSAGYCDEKNSIYCCIQTEDCSRKGELKYTCVSESKSRVTGYTCAQGYGSREKCDAGKCVEGYAEIECKMGCDSKTGKCIETMFVFYGTYICPKEACSQSGGAWSCDISKCTES